MINAGYKMIFSREWAGKEFGSESQEPCKPKGPLSHCSSSERWCREEAVEQGWHCPARRHGALLHHQNEKNGKHKQKLLAAKSNY